ncbi:MAG: T9SS type A sorting domain-containing protein [Bacteroidetes bacterium]|nr:T9SS type A sorting domain-containing protein [Bacteroidota bacterium]MBK8343111.1 T9SS type A sorting domain-containing protein [Bacteroidota bacterium]
MLWFFGQKHTLTSCVLLTSYSFEIISATGQVVLFGDWDVVNTSISLIDIPAGIYTARLSFNETLVSITFIKIK